jgi:hypothetical protein
MPAQDISFRREKKVICNATACYNVKPEQMLQQMKEQMPERTNAQTKTTMHHCPE